MFSTVLNSIFVLCFIMAAGFICRKKGIITENGSPVLSGILLNATLPSLMIVSMQKEFNDTLFKNSLFVLFLTLITHVFGYIVGAIACKLLKAPEDEKGIWIFTMMFPNLTYMGMPVLESIYGQEAVFYASMATFVFNIISFSIGVKVITSSKSANVKLNWKKLVFNLPIIGTIAGFTFFVTSVALPEIILKPLTLLGNMTTPLSMLVIGSLLAAADLRTVFSGWKTYVIILLRLVFMPLCLFAALVFLVDDSLIIGSMVLLTGMPAAAVTAILAAEYGQNSIAASKMVFLSTVLSIITIPILTLLF